MKTTPNCVLSVDLSAMADGMDDEDPFCRQHFRDHSEIANAKLQEA
jgi:hypothetical protein